MVSLCSFTISARMTLLCQVMRAVTNNTTNIHAESHSITSEILLRALKNNLQIFLDLLKETVIY
jgi:hypothetical protein